MKARIRSETGQSTVEWIGLIALLAVLMVALAAAGIRIPPVALAQSVAKKILCAASLAGSCAGEGSLDKAYGREVAGLVRAGTPTLMYGRDMLGLPVDYRTCRSPWCAEWPGEGEVGESTAGEPVTLFTRVIDCRDSATSPRETEPDCSNGRRGGLYVQYWAYYPESASLRGAPVLEDEGYHQHDWESIQVRVGGNGTISQRASSHAGYNHTRSAANWGADLGWGFLTDLAETAGMRPEGGWGKPTWTYLIAGGSHAGNVDGKLGSDEYPSYTPASRIRLVPLESIKDAPLSRPARFDPITPPWKKKVFNDGESEGTG